MQRYTWLKPVRWAALVLMGGGLLLPVTAFGEEGRRVIVAEVEGNAQAQVGGRWQPIRPGMALSEKETIRTSEGASVSLLIDDKGRGGRFKLREQSQLSLAKLDRDPRSGDQQTELDLAIGEVLVKVEKLRGDSTFEVKTPVSTTGVRGTLFEVDYEDPNPADDIPGRSETKTYEGVVEVTPERPEKEEAAREAPEAVVVPAGKSASVEEGRVEMAEIPVKELEDGKEETQDLLSAAPEPSPSEGTPTEISSGSETVTAPEEPSSPETQAPPEPQASPPEPEASQPEPEASQPEPEASPPEPQASQPEPEASPPEPQASQPEPEASPPEPQASQPEPEASPQPPSKSN
ncbi:MAG: FecR domain-containing protein [Candidatus Omnitrophica bacterium]|nr:FecR domain-containing protein [Candidatus Omnitrophota bacterium]